MSDVSRMRDRILAWLVLDENTRVRVFARSIWEHLIMHPQPQSEDMYLTNCLAIDCISSAYF